MNESFPTGVTVEAISVTTEIDHVITCSVSGLSAGATVEFEDPNGSVIDNPDPNNYVVVNGFDSYSGGNQEATLTIKPAILRPLTSPATYKCNVKSLTYPDSPAQENDVVVTKLTFGKHNEL